jgi:hypothetical protein
VAGIIAPIMVAPTAKPKPRGYVGAYTAVSLVSMVQDNNGREDELTCEPRKMFEPILPPPMLPKSIRKPMAAARLEGLGKFSAVQAPTWSMSETYNDVCKSEVVNIDGLACTHYWSLSGVSSRGEEDGKVADSIQPGIVHGDPQDDDSATHDARSSAKLELWRGIIKPPGLTSGQECRPT